MMNLRKSTKAKMLRAANGAVSVFMIIILVPMMTLACLFVDMSRRRLAQSVVDSAGDLALNTALTQYDTLLENYYGLFASSQNIDETLNKMEDYFVTAIKSSGLSDEDAQLYAKKLIGGGEDSITDILNIALDKSEGSGFKMEMQPGGCLSNPTLLKSQIVNFMKYRGPINTGMSLLTSIKSFANLNKETECIESRTKYYEAEKEVNTTCKEAWENINEYNKLDCCTQVNYGVRDGKSQNYFQGIRYAVTSNDGEIASFKKVGIDPYNYKACYQKIIDEAISNVYVSNNRDAINGLTYSCPFSNKMDVTRNRLDSGQSISNLAWYSVNNGKNTFNQNSFRKPDGVKDNFSIKTKTIKDEEGNVIEKIVTITSTNDTKLESAIDQAEDAYSKLVNKLGEIGFNNSEWNFDEKAHNPVRYVYDRTKKVTDGGKQSADNLAKDFLDKMQAVAYYYYWVITPEKADNYSECTVKWTNGEYTTDDIGQLSSRYSKLRNYFSNENSDFRKYQKFSAELADKTINVAIPAYNESLKTIDALLKQTSESIQSFMDVLESAVDYLNNASSKLKTIIDALAKDGTLAKAKENWSGSVNKLDNSSSIAAQDKAELENISKQFRIDDIKTLKTRIDNIIDGIGKDENSGIRGQLSACKFGSTNIKKINGYDEKLRGVLHYAITKNGATNITPSETVSQASLDAASKEIMSSTTWAMNTEYKSSVFDFIPKNESNPLLKEQTCKFYVYLYSHFNEKGDRESLTDPNNNEVKSENKNLSKKGDKTEDAMISQTSGDVKKLAEPVESESKNKIPDVTSAKNLPSSPSTPIPKLQGGTKNNTYTEGYSSEENNAETNKEKAVNSAKNKSQSLFENVGRWVNNLGTKLRDNIYLTEYIMEMFSYDLTPFSVIGNSSSKPDSGSGKITTFKSLTLEVMSAENNRAFGHEIEYVIYGGTNAQCTAAAYASIYGVRLCLNLIFAFTCSELRSETLAIATPISAATMGVIPAPLIQAGLLAAYSIGESGYDLYQISQGVKLKLYKSYLGTDSSSWHTCIAKAGSTLASVATEATINVAVDKAIKPLANAGIDKLNDILDNAVNYGEEKANEVNQDIQKTISDMYTQVVDEQAAAAINEITSALTSYTELERYGDEALESASEYVAARLNKWLDSTQIDAGNATIQKARKAIVSKAMDKISEGIIDSLHKKIVEANQNSDNAASAGAIADAIKSELDGIKSSLCGAVDFSDEIKSVSSEIQASIHKGTDKLRSTVNEKLNGLCGTTSGSGKDDASNPVTGGVGSLFAFDYRDYLRLFLLIKTMSSPNVVLMRTADLIQVNMAKVSKNGSYQLSKSACYIHIHADAVVDPLFLALPLISEYSKVDERGGFRYSISYDKVKGY